MCFQTLGRYSLCSSSDPHYHTMPLYRLCLWLCQIVEAFSSMLSCTSQHAVYIFCNDIFKCCMKCSEYCTHSLLDILPLAKVFSFQTSCICKLRLTLCQKKYLKFSCWWSIEIHTASPQYSHCNDIFIGKRQKVVSFLKWAVTHTLIVNEYASL